MQFFLILISLQLSVWDSSHSVFSCRILISEQKKLWSWTFLSSFKNFWKQFPTVFNFMRSESFQVFFLGHFWDWSQNFRFFFTNLQLIELRNFLFFFTITFLRLISEPFWVFCRNVCFYLQHADASQVYGTRQEIYETLNFY